MCTSWGVWFVEGHASSTKYSLSSHLSPLFSTDYSRSSQIVCKKLCVGAVSHIYKRHIQIQWVLYCSLSSFGGSYVANCWSTALTGRIPILATSVDTTTGRYYSVDVTETLQKGFWTSKAYIGLMCPNRTKPWH